MMNKSLAMMAVAGVAVLTGCAKDKTSMAKDENVLAVSPTPGGTPPQTVAVNTPPDTVPQNVIYDVPPPVDNTPPAARTYTVKKGDTLFGIAKANYGTGKDWQKITAANPGLEPSKLRAGQKINLP